MTIYNFHSQVVDLPYINVSFVDFEVSMDAFAAERSHGLQTPKKLIVELTSLESQPGPDMPGDNALHQVVDGSLTASPGLLHDEEEMTMFNHLAYNSARQYSTRASAVLSSQIGDGMPQALLMVGNCYGVKMFVYCKAIG